MIRITFEKTGDHVTAALHADRNQHPKGSTLSKWAALGMSYAHKIAEKMTIETGMAKDTGATVMISEHFVSEDESAIQLRIDVGDAGNRIGGLATPSVIFATNVHTMLQEAIESVTERELELDDEDGGDFFDGIDEDYEEFCF